MDVFLNSLNPFLAGIIVCGILYGISGVSTGSWNPFALACGDDNNISVSLLQFLIFTYLTVFAYIFIFVKRYQILQVTTLTALPNNSLLPSIPLNLLILMGLAATTAAASKGIVVSYVNQGKLSGAGNDADKKDPSGVVTEKNGQVALIKVQMLIWTVITVAIYFINLMQFKIDMTQAAELPDIDTTLLILTGVSQGAYIGGKLVTTNTGPVIVSITPKPVSQLPQGQPRRVTILGAMFGSPQGNSSVVQYRNLTTKAENTVSNYTAWNDSKIEFDAPADMLQPGQYEMWVTVDGKKSDNYNIEVTDKIPIIESITPSPIPQPPQGQPGRVTISGSFFGSPRGNSSVVKYRNFTTQAESIVLNYTDWNDSKIEFDAPADMLQPGTYAMWVTVDGKKSDNYNIEVTQ